MKIPFIVLPIVLACLNPAIAQEGNVERVATFKGAQVTGVTVSKAGRIFVNFPLWRENIPCSVAEVSSYGSYKPYPDYEWNSWKPGEPVNGEKFVCVQSVVAHNGKLYVLDTKNPFSKKTIAIPTVYVFGLNNNKLVKSYKLDASTKPGSYVNDLRVDDKNAKIYFTDSNEPGLIVLDMESGENYRVLDRDPYTSAEFDTLTIDGKKHSKTVHSDGIELDGKNNILYFHALSAYTLYGIPTEQLISRNVDKSKIFKITTPAPDGMIMDAAGNLFLGDLEKNAIVYLTPDRKTLRTLAQSNGISWPDTFSIHGGYLYFTNSRIHEVEGDISDMDFSLDRIKLPAKQIPNG